MACHAGPFQAQTAPLCSFTTLISISYPRYPSSDVILGALNYPLLSPCVLKERAKLDQQKDTQLSPKQKALPSQVHTGAYEPYWSALPVPCGNHVTFMDARRIR
jgi:hypothetical protein